jgi:chemotaxis protein CheY-P-specific phosphatase CheC
MNGPQTKMEFLLTNSFESGYTNASHSLTQLTKCKAAHKKVHHGTVKFDADFLQAEEYIRFSGSHVLLTTQIFGDVSGKSYLFLSERALEILTKTIPANPNSSIDFKEEFIKELNNILSAAVLTKLSNFLSKKMFGDVPELIGKVNCHLNDIIHDDFSEEMEEVYINSIYFSLEEHEGVFPLFIWVLDKSTLIDGENAD